MQIAFDFTIAPGWAWFFGYIIAFIIGVVALFITQGAPRHFGEWFAAMIAVCGVAVAAMAWPLALALTILAAFCWGIQTLWRLRVSK